MRPECYAIRRRPDETPLVRDKPVTGFTNSEEAAVGLTDVVPFLVEDMLKKNGARYSKGPDWQSHVVVAGNLITGQNPGVVGSRGQSVTRETRRDVRGR